MSRPADLIRTLTERGLTIAVAESLTGGLVVAELVSIPGASAVVRGGIVAYATELKHDLLGVDAALLAAGGPIQAAVAEQMASGVRERLRADIGLATTGAAGPDPQDGHAPGEVWIAVATAAGIRSVRLELGGDRASIRRETVDAAIELASMSLPE
ncbi:CinA family protein [Pseudolysinimonas yzui]|uniref:Competence damage-inducible protein A n=1 Tax=Pseudolysinimonas yzui TaxID=2708254 RepID=A0A8J3GPE9_9MICO|nr:CinA family protein [Pseudolysinimonas yzui]GHF11239.1 competence damage-inducible protein A [Pseudolysinimonas yzui]